MKCTCGLSTSVKDGRYTEHGYWRKRKCACGKEYTTLEQFCETEKGSRGGNRKVIQPKIIKPPLPPKITVTKAKNNQLRPVIPKKKTPKPAPLPADKPAWSRIADLKAQKEIDDL